MINYAHPTTLFNIKVGEQSELAIKPICETCENLNPAFSAESLVL